MTVVPGQQGGEDRQERPVIDADRLTRWLAGLDPADRIVAADEARAEALRLVGLFAAIRRAAVVEAHVQGADIMVSEQSIREALRLDRELLQAALRILTRNGVSSASPRQLAQGLAPRAPLEVVARRVLTGVEHLHSSAISGQEHDLVMAAHERAGQLLPTG